MINRDTVIKKIMDMPQEQVAKLLIFMADMEAAQSIDEQNETKQIHEPAERLIQICTNSESDMQNGSANH